MQRLEFQMKNSYYNELVHILMANPQGVRVGKIARHIYNSDVDLFDRDTNNKFSRIHAELQRYLWTQSRKKRSPFERVGWGLYGLKRPFVVQLELTFEDWDDEGLILDDPDNKKKGAGNKTLMNDLFADFFSD